MFGSRSYEDESVTEIPGACMILCVDRRYELEPETEGAKNAHPFDVSVAMLPRTPLQFAPGQT